MPRTHFTTAEMQNPHELAHQWGNIIARRTGDDAISFDLSVIEQTLSW